MTISTETAYKQAFAQFDELIARMGDNEALQNEARALAEAIQAYEQAHIPFPKPTTLIGMIELKMYERRLKQKDLAQLLNVETSRISELLNGKRRLTLDLAKQLHEKLDIDGNFILEAA
ncbi:helix-turn-helix domain-containing protein [Fibrella aquatilis]|uniref:Helix-turn-helix domain-containing protein n=1 Tax=Fibrella aquatilis TaxID=2817059 RepID=A0A939JVJ4_9BACT|nr:helix-turn-helix domain-containing protein [Fibrella aquatilis]MBO0930922.1 helix-turn-helix domain-containing protein [Fibrella aquatilis]